tara:strand:+ start:1402 stop:2211 length:810 start_codon:yes stop_codon:yes gene_type:complete
MKTKGKRKTIKVRKQKGGAAAALNLHKYNNSDKNELFDNILHNFSKQLFGYRFSGQGLAQPTMGPNHYQPGSNGILYLYGYGDFIGEHKLIPFDVKDSELFRRINYKSIWNENSSKIKRIYYYLTPVVYKNCIIEHKLISSISSQGGLPYFIGYNGKKPESTYKGETIQANKKDLYGSKFLMFPPVDDYVIYDFKPVEGQNIYNVPNIGDVILNKPFGDENIWEDIRIIFEKGFIPPEIKKTNNTSNNEGPTFNTTLAVGQLLFNRKNR